MNTILLRPTDVLFFRDGRPMTGSLAGHGAAWPMPNVINAAFHAALHRSGFAEEAHSHRRGARGIYAEDAVRDRKFGSLVTAGPFPVKDGKNWFFPRPQDLQDATTRPALLPTDLFDSATSSLPKPLKYAVGNRIAPSKEVPSKAWLSSSAFERYLMGHGGELGANDTLNDADFADTESSIGIAVDPLSGVAGRGDAEGAIYSAHYLRLRDNWQLGVCAVAEDKKFRHEEFKGDLIKALFNGGNRQIVVGGQQRICSAARAENHSIALPRGMSDGFPNRNGKFLVKWVMLSPAVWPEIAEDSQRNIRHHCGGWLPNWVDSHTGAVLLKAGEVQREEGEGRDTWRNRVRRQQRISAKLVAAIVPKPVVVTGWSLPDEEMGEQGGAQSAHLAVAAGAVYYFEADSSEEAVKLSAALNWHGGEINPTAIINRRSTLLGEKGFGIGVCGGWEFLGDVPGRPAK